MSARKKIIIGVLLLVVLVWANNTSLFSKQQQRRPQLLAHRGVGQDYPLDGVTADTCTASRIFQPRNTFIENTLPSMREAFKDGADIVEFDIHPTVDGDWAVFHDWTLECRTEGHGVTREQKLSYLKTLDVGYGYTADGGRTFPLRGQGVGLMPSLDEVLNAFPEKSFLLHIKSNDPNEGSALVAKLKTLPDAELRRLLIHGGERPMSIIRAQLPSVRTWSPQAEKRCLSSYLALGWSGYVPSDCRNSVLMIPSNIGSLLWGWPNKFLGRMERAGTSVFVWDEMSLKDMRTGRSKGLNSVQDLQKLPSEYSGGIWTDNIEVIGPQIRDRK